MRAAEWQTLREIQAARARRRARRVRHGALRRPWRRPDEWWRDWAERSASSAAQAMFLAWDDDRAVGIAGIFGDEGSSTSSRCGPIREPRSRRRPPRCSRPPWRSRETRRSSSASPTDNDAARRLYERSRLRRDRARRAARSNPIAVIHELRLVPMNELDERIERAAGSAPGPAIGLRRAATRRPTGSS